jgi:hypothetical protein
MPAMWKEGDRVRIVTREVTAKDRSSARYYAHMAGLPGEVQNVYGPDEVAVKIDLERLSPVAGDVHAEAVRRMRAKFLEQMSEEAKSKLSREELDFTAHYVLLVRSGDLERA